MVDLQAAYAACARDCRTHYENFPVASLLLPRRMRPHVAALYAFARAADDFADEGERTVEERHRLLDRWRGRLLDAVSGTTSTMQRPPEPGEPAHTQEIFLALGVTVRRLQLPSVASRRSAERVSAGRDGHALRDLAGAVRLLPALREPDWPPRSSHWRLRGTTISIEWSDAICTALQLTNFWQDVRSDYARGRIYLPLEEMQVHRR